MDNLAKRLFVATIVLIVALFALVLFCSRAFAQTALRPFAANETRTADKKTTTRKIYVTDHAVRIETNGDANGQGSIAIVRLDLNQIDILSPARNTNISPIIRAASVSPALACVARPEDCAVVIARAAARSALGLLT